MKKCFKNLILILLLSQSFIGLAQSAGFNNTFAILSLNGAANSYYDLNAATANADFNGANLGTFNPAYNSLILKGGEHNVWKCGGCDLTSTRLYYRIYLTGGSGGSFTAVNLPWTSGFNNGCGGQDQMWSSTTGNINILSGLNPGTYNLELYSDASVTCSGGSVYASNNGSNYIATFTVSADFISLNTIGATSLEDFNALVNSGTGVALPTGWRILETGTAANNSYTAGTGSTATGDSYSFGATGSTERALGGVQSGSLNPSFGAKFLNSTASTIASLTISYTGETWRVGSAGRADRLNFQYSTDATSLNTGTWIDVDSLDYYNIAHAATQTGSMIHSANRSFTFGGLSIATGTNFWIRWTDLDAAGSDDGMAIDDFSIKPCFSVAVPTTTAQTFCSGALVSNLSATGTAIQWYSNSTGGASLSGTTALTSATYYVTQTLSNCESARTSSIVTLNNLPTVSAGSNQTVCAGTSVTLSGSGASTYTWNNSVQNGVAFTPSTTQTYTVTGTDANGCTNTSQVQVAVNALPTVSAGSNQTVCEGTSVTLSGSGANTYTWNNSVQNGVAFTPSSTQTYTVTGTDANGCTNTAQVTVTVNALPNVSAGQAQTVCAGTSVTLSGSGASTYTWNNNVQDGVAFTPSTTQTYTVTGTDANGCTNTAQVQVAVNALPTVSAGQNQAVCAGTSVTLSGSGAASYTWNNGVTNAVAFTPNATTTYTVTGTDANGCTNTAQVQVAVNALPTVSAGSNQTVCAGTSVTLNGSGAQSYTWNNNVQDGVAFTPSTTQTYTVTGTDANGCTNTAQVQVAVNALPTVSAGQNQAVCAGTAVTLNGSGAQSFTWNNNVQNGVAFTPSTTQSYTVTGTAANGCTNTAQVQVAVNALPAVSAGQNQAVCAGTSVTLSGSGAQSYTWNNNVQDGVAFTPSTTQSYTVTGTDANGCTNTAQVQVAVNALPTVSAGQNQAVCAGTSVTLSGSGASSYSWNNGVTNAVAFTPSTTQSYTVTGTDANGCTNTAQLTVTVNALPTISAGQNQAVCAGTSVTLNGSGAQSYTWNNNVQDGVAFTPSTTQTYTVTGTDANGCTNTAQVQVAVNALPTVSAGQNQTVCAGTAVTLNGSGAQSYTWNNNVQDGVAFTPNNTQTYTVTGTAANGCTNTAQVQVAVNALPTVSAGQNQTVCAGTSVTLSGSGAASYTWNNGVTNAVAFTPNATTTYTVTGTDANGCTNTAQVQVAVNALPTVSAGQNQAVCIGNTVTLSGSGAQSYTWNNNVQDGVAFTPSTTQSYTVTGTDANGCTNTAQVQVAVNALPTVSAGQSQAVCTGTSVTLSGSGANTYTWNNNVQDGVAFTPSTTQSYTVTGTDANGCTNTALVTVTVNALPTVGAGQNQTVCAGTAVTLNGSGANTYTWNNNVQNAVAFIPNATTTYTVTGTDANGCTNTAQVQVAVNALPTVSAGQNQAVCAGTSVTLSGSGASTYTWNNNVQDGVAFTPSTTQSYAVIGTDANGCTNTAQVTVTVNALPTVSGGQNQAVCAGNTVTLSGSGAQSYTWNNNVQNGVAFTPNTTQSYTVTGTDVNGCTNTAQVTVTVNTLPFVSAGLPMAICQGSSVILYGSGAQTYTWNNGVQNAVSFVPTNTQTYTVVGTDQNGCQGTAQVAVTVNPIPAVSGGPNQTICSGSLATLTGTGASSYSWSGGVQNGVAFIPQANQTYSVTGTSAAGCQATAQVTITVVNNPVVSGGANQIVCPGSQVTLTGSGATTYVWSNGVQNGVPFVPTSTQTYTVTGTLNGGCSSTAQVTVTVSTPPNVNAGNNISICAGDSVMLSATGANTYSWSGGIQNGTYITPNSTQTYTVTGVDGLGCSNSDAVTITVNQATSSTLTTTACNSYILNGQTYSQSGTYTQVIPNALGCDSTITLNLTINVPPAIPVITAMNGVTLVSSTQDNVSYQWIFCNSGLPIANATDTMYTTSINGNFAVVVSNGCGSVTSNCISIDNVGVHSVDEEMVSIYPNPTLNHVIIDGLKEELTPYVLTDAQGRVIAEGVLSLEEDKIDLSPCSNGIYWLTLRGYKPMELVKQ